MEQFTFRQSAGLELLVCVALENQGFINAFTTRTGGTSSLPSKSLNLGNYSQDSISNITENRRRLKEALRLANCPLLTISQIHSTDVQAVTSLNEVRPYLESRPPTGDGLMTCLTDHLIAVQTADCVPLLVGDRRTGATAAIHAGWRGTVKGIVTRTIAQMQGLLNVRPADLMVAIGPAVGPCCFEVGSEVIDAFHQARGPIDPLFNFHQPNGRVNLNLRLANRLQLLQSGVSDSSIYDCNLCTICQNDKFFSYRLERGAERPVGRQMGLISRWSGDE